MPRPSTKVYLGDAVYAELDDFGAIVLTTEDGIRATNRIVLEREVCEALDRWRKAAVARKIEEGTEAIRRAARNVNGEEEVE